MPQTSCYNGLTRAQLSQLKTLLGKGGKNGGFSCWHHQAKEPTAHEQMKVPAGFNYTGMYTATKAKIEESEGLIIWLKKCTNSLLGRCCITAQKSQAIRAVERRNYRGCDLHTGQFEQTVLFRMHLKSFIAMIVRTE